MAILSERTRIRLDGRSFVRAAHQSQWPSTSRLPSDQLTMGIALNTFVTSPMAIIQAAHDAIIHPSR